MLDGFPQAVELARFVEEEFRPTFQASLPKLGEWVVGEDDDYGGWRMALDILQDLQSVAPDRVRIQDHHIGLQRLDGLCNFGRAVGLPNDLDVRRDLGDHARHSVSQDRGVINEKHPQQLFLSTLAVIATIEWRMTLRN